MLLSLLRIFRTNLNEVHFTEFFERRRVKDVEDSDDVFVVEVAEEFDFAEGAEAMEAERSLKTCWGSRNLGSTCLGARKSRQTTKISAETLL